MLNWVMYKQGFNMSVVNIGTAENLFRALKESLNNAIWILVKQ